MDPFTIYKYASSGFFALQSIPLLLNPDGIINDLTPKPAGSVKTPSTTPIDNPMARYFARFAGFTSLALSVATLILTDSLGFLLPTRTGNVAGSSKDAAIVISSVYLTSIASLAGYMGMSTGISGYFFHTVVGSVLTSLGAYCYLNA